MQKSANTVAAKLLYVKNAWMCECPLNVAYQTNGSAAGNRYGKIFRRVKNFRRLIKMYSMKIIAANKKILIVPCPRTAIFL